jgi:DNA primase
MAAGGTDPFVERVREATDIAEVIGAHVALKRAGSRLAGLCPFHQEKTPSFYVNPSMQAFHCFGCGAGGDVFTFVMQYEKMSFPEALRSLAERAGIPIPERRGPPSDQLERIREALRVARGFYRERLEGPAGREGREYLDRRGIGTAMRELYGLGLAPDSWDALLDHARRLVSERTLIEAGLAVESDAGRIYDRFRNRLMIPIDTAGGVPVGFGGRALGDQEPKYLNSPETPVYRKGSILFGMGPAREGIRAGGRVLLVEGYFDVVALVQGGIGGVVGTCGTALTVEQVAMLKRLSERVVLLFDGDAAGLRAALRALPLLAGEVSQVRVATPPAGKDPDLWIREEGADSVRAALEEAPAPLAFLHRLVLAGTMTAAEAARRAVEQMARMKDPLERDLWIQEAAGRFDIRTEAFDKALRRARGERGAGPARSPTDPDRPAPSPRVQGAAWTKLERSVLRSALAWPGRAGEIAAAVEEAGGMAGVIPYLRWVAGKAAERNDLDAAALLSMAAREHPDSGELTAAGMAEGAGPESPDSILVQIRMAGVSRRLAALEREVSRAQETGDQEALVRIQGEQQRLARERARLASLRASRMNPGES